MKSFFFTLFFCFSAGASLFSPVLECKNAKKSFALTIRNRTEGTIGLKRKLCPIRIVELDQNKNGSGRNAITLNYEIDNCHVDTFYKQGFLKITPHNTKGFIAYILALNGSQTFDCDVTAADVKKLQNLK